MIRIEHNGAVLRLFSTEEAIPIVRDWTPVAFQSGWLAWDGTFFYDTCGAVPGGIVSTADFPQLAAVVPVPKPTGRRYSSVAALVAAECSPEVQALYRELCSGESAAAV